MLIAIDGSEAFVKNKTGVESYAYQIILNLAKIDRRNHYIVYLDPRLNTLGGVGKWPENFMFKALKWPILWTQLGLALQTFIDPIDLLFSPSHTTPLLHRPGLKTVVTVHDLGVEFLPLTHQFKQALYLKWISRVQLKLATKLIAVSKATKKDLMTKIGINGGKIAVIYEALVPLERNEVDTKVNGLRQFGLEKERYFLFVGTIQPRKNLVRLIQAFAQFLKTGPVSAQPCLQSPVLALAGSRGWSADQIYRLPEELGIEDKVRFLGRLESRDLAVLYSNALAFVYPSLFEGFGLPILEAFNFDCPVITSNVSSMPEVSGQAALLVDPYSEEEICRAMVKLSKDHKLRRELVEKGREQLKKFSWDKAARQTLSVFEEVCR